MLTRKLSTLHDSSRVLRGRTLSSPEVRTTTEQTATGSTESVVPRLLISMDLLEMARIEQMAEDDVR